MTFTPAQLLEQLAQLPPAQRYWVAYSGGCDSTVLLHALATLRGKFPAELQALHVNHNLHEAASTWAAHCRGVCEALTVPLTEVDVDARSARGESPEAAARAARYGIFAEVLKVGDGLLLAHHRDDQADTLLLQLLRGSGPRGLAAMPLHRPQGAGWLGRPLLGFSRQDLCRYAEAEAHHDGEGNQGDADTVGGIGIGAVAGDDAEENQEAELNQSLFQHGRGAYRHELAGGGPLDRGPRA